LQTVDTVFVRHALPKGEMTHRGIRVDPAQIRRVALLTVEASTTISRVSVRPRRHIGCASTFPRSARPIGCSLPSVITACSTGSRFRSEIVPRISDFVLSNNIHGARSSGSRAVKGRTGGSAPTNGSALGPVTARATAAE